ncbi:MULTISPECIES: cation diffusion facilitator family transporter [Pseudovibrio]|uniref:cation diffusion facilitator family transporter n=1 Tax=Stappiaceae TaxID=2821832 RepID=UPI00236658A1|nr:MULTISPECIES: cation diffusion facilitator family transporter [Pseudovibrio]MDD7909444.1 cation diffusion facilitator family transporter [Pseudovibrio exalbescens]MDX5595003.1 cation diffusion facilitator family transporter [Pseudovibrio sp. SPO723]
MNESMRFALGSIVVGLIVLATKYAAYLYTGSIAFYSDALESIINVASALAAAGALHLAQKPADHNHPYGHTKVEYFAAVLEGVLIVLAAVTILRQAYISIMEGPQLEYSLFGFVLNGAASVLNFIWASALMRVGRKHRSPALVADGKHIMTDVYTSVGVIVGVGAAYATGWTILDPILAIVVAVNILWSGWHLVRESIGGLMDEAAPEEEQELLRTLISKHGEGAIEAHDLRTRHSGHVTFVDFHLVVPADMTVLDAHEICDRIEEGIAKELPGARVTIHIEPENHAKHSGIVVI